jgi:hypothetical protein
VWRALTPRPVQFGVITGKYYSYENKISTVVYMNKMHLSSVGISRRMIKTVDSMIKILILLDDDSATKLQTIV